MNSRDYKSEVLTAPLAYRILREVSREEEITPKEISEKLESSQKTISNYLRGLRENNFVYVKRTEGRKSIYSVNYTDIQNFHHERWLSLREKWHEVSKNFEKEEDDFLIQLGKTNPHTSEEEKKKMKEENPELWEQNEKISDFIEHYIENYLERIDDSTIEDMLIDDYADSITKLMLMEENRENEVPEWLEVYSFTIMPVVIYYTKAGKTLQAVSKSFDQVKKND